ncbi:MAG: DEAD/DEAH box helicase family protein [Deltaproteobacteria bacterium]|nr:DEAD/DEAH box helicase family protein [Deltaproteobacteria bacterium]
MGASIHWESGSLTVRDVDDPSILPAACRWDERTRCHRAPAVAYAEVVMALHRRKLPYDDQARGYEELPHGLVIHRKPRPYQEIALRSWQTSRGRGVVVLPTGAGKSWLACMAIDAKKRSTLVIAPTLDLVRQWYDLLRSAFDQPVGIVGGGDHTVERLTVTTYDSAYIHMEHLGRRFGMVVFDEVHHLPGNAYSMAARMCLAPYRLGLSATPERTDGRHDDLDELVGPLVHRQDITELTGSFLADYDVETVTVDLSPEELEAYHLARSVYREFVFSQGIRMSSPGGWGEFIMRSAGSEKGRRAMNAYREQRRIAFSAPSKLNYVDHLLHRHRGDRSLIFTADNDTAYRISREFLVPVITHKTKVSERSAILDGLKEGRFRAVATSKVLNEGVDVPSANVAIIVSGSGSVREHVQRLGRVLRKQPDKRATLYELVSGGTSEQYTSERRRDHKAYGGGEAAEG